MHINIPLGVFKNMFFCDQKNLTSLLTYHRAALELDTTWWKCTPQVVPCFFLVGKLTCQQVFNKKSNLYIYVQYINIEISTGNK